MEAPGDEGSREGLTDYWAFEEGLKGEGLAYGWLERVAGEGNSMCQGPEVGECLVSSSPSRAARVATAEWAENVKE